MSYSFSIGDLSDSLNDLWSDEVEIMMDARGYEKLDEPTMSELASAEIKTIEKYIHLLKEKKKNILDEDFDSIIILLESIHVALDL